jgi:hypothetical protein
MKAWRVYDRTEGYTYLVYAGTRNRARTLARCCPGIDEADWVDIYVNRAKAIDGERNEECVLDWDDNVELYDRMSIYNGESECA